MRYGITGRSRSLRMRVLLVFSTDTLKCTLFTSVGTMIDTLLLNDFSAIMDYEPK